MKYKAEIFDRLQYLYEETKFNDHQLHCVIKFKNRLNREVLEKSICLLLETVPILSCVYVHHDGDSYWESSGGFAFSEICVIVNNEEDFHLFTASKILEEKGPQIKFCFYRSENDSLSVIMNHMVCDAAGFKMLLYLFSDIYSKLTDDPAYMPKDIYHGDRSIRKVIERFGVIDKVKSLLFQNGDNNKNDGYLFPMDQDDEIQPFILTHEIDEETCIKLQAYCKQYNVTVNDVALTAYMRALVKLLNIKKGVLHIPVMIDMRRYLQEKEVDSFANISSTVIIRTTVCQEESFAETLSKVNRQMKKNKAGRMGLNVFLKLQLLFKLFGDIRGYSLVAKKLKNPNICMTNIGVIDHKRLYFKDAPIINSFMCGSIKYRPHFQMALSSFKNRITFSSNLYGSRKDRKNILHFYSLLDRELDF